MDETGLQVSRCIHFVAAGGSIHDTFKKSLRCDEFGIDEVYVIRQELSDEERDPEISKEVEHAILAVRSLCEDVGIVFNQFTIKTSGYEGIVEYVLSIYNDKKNQNSKYYCNITGGTKPLSIGLFLASIWIEAIPYYFHRGRPEPDLYTIPKINIKNLKENPNYIEILHLLNEKDRGLSNTEILIRMNDDNKYTRVKPGRGEGRLKKSNLSHMMGELVEWGLIKVREGPDKRTKNNQITRDGRLALKLYL